VRATTTPEEGLKLIDLPESMIVHPMQTTGSARLDVSEANPFQLEAMERNHLQSILEQFKFNKVHTAKALGISRRSLYRLIANITWKANTAMAKCLPSDSRRAY
jgi:DNA-binding NtrC family response regulator